MRAAWLIPTAFAFAACGAATTPDAGVEAPPADAAASADAALAPDAGESPDAGPMRPPDICDHLSLPRRPYQDHEGGLLFGDLATDFSVHTITGETWNLREEWTGCESYVFLTYFADSTGNALFNSELAGLLTGSAPNVHYFFASTEPTEDARRTRIEDLMWRAEDTIALHFEDDEEEQARQRRRVHFVLDRADEIEGSAGAFVSDYVRFAQSDVVDIGDGRRAPAPRPYSFAIDREQRWDAGDNLNEYVGGPVLFDMASYLGAFFDYKAGVAARFESERAVTRTLVETTTTARIFVREVTLPPAAEMAAFDTMELEVRIVCPHRNPFACSEWDRIAGVQLCMDAQCADRREIARWITPYWRRGEQLWAIDASPFLGYLRQGGARRFRVETGPDWERATRYEVRVTLRLSTRGGGAPRAIAVEPAFSGGGFNAMYNMRAPFHFTPPAGATRVELVAILSGHGQASGSNCAEWCDHRHQFTLNGTALPLITPGPGVGSTRGCAARAKDGVPPGQWGNWGPQRAYWCPGMPVAPIRLDLTAGAIPNRENTLEYGASWAGRAPPGGDIALSSYVVYYQ